MRQFDRMMMVVCLLGLLLPTAGLAAKADGKKAKLIAAHDKNGNGVVDGEEMTTLRKAFEADKEGALAAYDKDGNGSLSDAEILAIKPGADNKSGKKPGKKAESSAANDMDPPGRLDPVPAVAPASLSTASFHHPGVLVNRAQLDFIKAQVAAGAEPWTSAFEQAKSSELGALAYTPTPWETCECGPRSNPNLGCKDEQRDSGAAYTQALLWYLSGDRAYATNAITIMNAWAYTLKGGHKLRNGPVQAAWCAEVWPRAAEIIRYSDAGWSSTDIEQFRNMLLTQYVPSLLGGSCENGNKELSMSEALINIGVFNDDRGIFEAGVAMWRGRAPAYIYLSSDGPEPVIPAGCEMAIWGNKGYTTPLVDGLLQETCRDSGHANMGLSAMVNAAETARQQGLDLYAEQGDRIMAALEYQAQFLPPHNTPAPENLAFNKHPTWEIAYNHFHNRLGHSLPRIKEVLPTNRPTGVNHHMVWETLTHAGVGAVGLPPLATP